MERILTMTQATTMTIPLVVSYVSDLFHSPDWPLFSTRKDLSDAPESDEIAALSFSAGERSTSLSLPEQVRQCWLATRQCLGSLLAEESSFSLFLAQIGWHEGTVLARRRGLWSGFGNFARSEGIIALGEMPFYSGPQLRFAGTLALNASSVPAALELCRIERAALLLINSIDDVVSCGTIRRLFESAFPLNAHGVADGMIDWARFVVNECQRTEVIVRVTGTHDDRTAYIDFFGRRSVMDRFAERCDLSCGFEGPSGNGV